MSKLNKKNKIETQNITTMEMISGQLYWILPLNGSWCIAKYIHGSYLALGGGAYKEEHLGQIGERVPSSNELFEANRARNEFIDTIKDALDFQNSIRSLEFSPNANNKRHLLREKLETLFQEYGQK